MRLERQGLATAFLVATSVQRLYVAARGQKRLAQRSTIVAGQQWRGKQIADFARVQHIWRGSQSRLADRAAMKLKQLAQAVANGGTCGGQLLLKYLELFSESPSGFLIGGRLGRETFCHHPVDGVR
jgi:hypothetical protein